MKSEFAQRMKKCREEMQNKDIDYIFLTPDANMFYVSGYDGEIEERHFFLVISQKREFFFVPDLYEEQVREKTWIKEFRTWSDSQNPKTELEKTLDIEDAGTILLSENMDARFSLDIMDIFSEAEYDLAGEVFEELRIRKGEEEIEKIRESSKIVDEVIREIREMNDGVVGKSEDELADVIEKKMFDKGAGSLSFDIIASSGSNGAKPHYRHGSKIIEAGEPVVLDFGCYKDQYPSDQTRTLVFSEEPSEKLREVHNIVREAQQKAVEKVEPGIEAREVDEAAREVIEETGYGEDFIHRTGHGVGLDIHEPPFITRENSRVLEEGMVFSIEPGIYLEGEFGVRIEDLVVVTEDGCRRLNKTERSWRT